MGTTLGRTIEELYFRTQKIIEYMLEEELNTLANATVKASPSCDEKVFKENTNTLIAKLIVC
jgi:hypothetical protein